MHCMRLAMQTWPRQKSDNLSEQALGKGDCTCLSRHVIGFNRRIFSVIGRPCRGHVGRGKAAHDRLLKAAGEQLQEPGPETLQEPGLETVIMPKARQEECARPQSSGRAPELRGKAFRQTATTDHKGRCFASNVSTAKAGGQA